MTVQSCWVTPEKSTRLAYVLPNADICWDPTCDLNKAYLVDWKARRNDGTRFKLYIKLNRDVKAGDEKQLHCATAMNANVGECMSDPVHVM